ncbi:MAG: glycoside hydrolase family 25 protein [Thermoanaerobaculia bacterium]
MSTGSSAAGIQGIDVSHYQGVIDWNLVAEAGMAFAFIKATEGISTVDPEFQDNWSGAKAAGLLRGAYHFYQPGDDPQQQAEYFLSVVQTVPGDLPPVLDVEIPAEASEIIAGAQAWLAAVAQATAKIPILYTSPSFWAQLGASVTGFSQFPLWVAEYGVTAPKIPEGWTAWTFWQFSESGSVSGIEGSVDLDIFQGTLQGLQQMARS